MAERWDGVGPYRDLFEALASRTMTMLVEREPGTGGTEEGVGLVETDNDLDWTQWIADIADTGMIAVPRQRQSDLGHSKNTPPPPHSLARYAE
ncbi:uncharacterized protein AB675_3167 [Cyphellophora attinorum]|uniref:Uncharacterized protein n=1 Tax=Cyphellophora attinorum TaxID=1664694 RepID=A0A0N1H845_9EURO|nr:uncharacterized protein AB675_3167 [Phialophora attinorum]KPI37990.1 hypothetical protein AB675_3167 [Phialophora attinorum]